MSDTPATVATTDLTVPINLGALPPDLLSKAKDIAKSIKIEDSNAIIQYGVGAQKNIAGFADSMLQSIRVKDAGDVGQSLTELMFKVKDAGVGDLTAERKGFFTNLFGGIQRFIAKYEKLETQIDKIVDQLNSSKMNLLRDVTMLDQLFAKNNEYLGDLDIFLAAGQMKLDDLKANDLPALEAKAKASSDPLDAQKLNDFNSFSHRFEKKLYDLKLSRIVAIQTAPQVRLIQNNDQALVEKIQSSIMTTIPLWKSQIVIAIALFRQKSAVKVQTDVDNATNDLLLKNSEMLKQGSIAVAQANERGIIEIETLKATNANLIETLESTIKIHEEGKAKRAAAEVQLTQIEAELKSKLTEIRQN
jgi:uncharacterized protein YaaN involved in tellurite resistance